MKSGLLKLLTMAIVLTILSVPAFSQPQGKGKMKGSKGNYGVCDSTGKRLGICDSTGRKYRMCDSTGRTAGLCDSTCRRLKTCDSTGRGIGCYGNMKFKHHANKCPNFNNANCNSNANNALKNKNGKQQSKPTFDVSQSSPNPTSGNAKISVNSSKQQFFKIDLFDQKGNMLKTVWEGTLGAGATDINLDLNGITPGTYFYKTEAGSYSVTKSIVVVK